MLDRNSPPPAVPAALRPCPERAAPCRRPAPSSSHEPVGSGIGFFSPDDPAKGYENTRARSCCSRRGAAPPHFITILADDLGWADTALYNPLAPTPRIKEEADQGLLLERHYVFRYCSPSRRAFLSGRFPTSITTVQPDGADACSDFLPLATTTLAEKLSRGAGYECHFIGKGHLGYETTDHLPIRRGFASHLGFLLGSESYYHGGGAANASEGAHDLWEDAAPACAAVVAGMNYSTDVYVGRALEKIGAAAAAPPGARAPLFVYLALQNVHDPYNEPPPGERGGPWPDFPLCADCTYAHMLHALDAAVGNVTAALRRGALWDETLLLFSAENGPIGGSGSSRPLRGRKHDPWEGGTRAAAFLAGGALPAALRGARSGAKLVHVADWYPTFLGLAGVDSAGDALIGGAPRPIDERRRVAAAHGRERDAAARARPSPRRASST